MGEQNIEDQKIGIYVIKHKFVNMCHDGKKMTVSDEGKVVNSVDVIRKWKEIETMKVE